MILFALSLPLLERHSFELSRFNLAAHLNASVGQFGHSSNRRIEHITSHLHLALFPGRFGREERPGNEANLHLDIFLWPTIKVLSVGRSNRKLCVYILQQHISTGDSFENKIVQFRKQDCPEWG